MTSPYLLYTPPPPRVRLRMITEDPNFQEDVRRIVRVSDALIAQLRERFDRVPFLDPQALRDCIEQEQELDVPTRSALLSAFTHLPSICNELQKSRMGFEVALRRAIAESESFSGDDVDTIVRKLALIAEPTTSQRLQWKAEWLSTAVGFPLSSLDFVTDLRPVFDQDRTEIKGFVTVTTMVLSTEEGNEVMASLTESDLEDLAIKVEHASNKIRAARENAVKQGFDVARTSNVRAYSGRGSSE